MLQGLITSGLNHVAHMGLDNGEKDPPVKTASASTSFWDDFVKFLADFTGGSQVVQIHQEAMNLSAHSDGSTDWAAFSAYSLMMEKVTNPGNLEMGRNLFRTPVKTKYHYTTKAGFNSIMKTKTINASIGAKNARFGSGQYFTDIVPGTLTKGQTSYRLYGVPWNGKRLTQFIEIETSGLNIIKNKLFNYLHPSNTPLNVKGRIVSGGKTGF